MKNNRYKNNFTGDVVTVTAVTPGGEGIKYVEYEKDIPVKAGSQVLSNFRKPEHVFNKAYSPCKN